MWQFYGKFPLWLTGVTVVIHRILWKFTSPGLIFDFCCLLTAMLCIHTVDGMSKCRTEDHAISFLLFADNILYYIYVDYNALWSRRRVSISCSKVIGFMKDKNRTCPLGKDWVLSPSNWVKVLLFSFTTGAKINSVIGTSSLQQLHFMWLHSAVLKLELDEAFAFPINRYSPMQSYGHGFWDKNEGWNHK